MARNFGSLVFTPVIKALQERYGNRRQYARLEEKGSSADRLGPEEAAFIAERDSRGARLELPAAHHAPLSPWPKSRKR
jgi:hypothetical protein